MTNEELVLFMREWYNDFARVYEVPEYEADAEGLFLDNWKPARLEQVRACVEDYIAQRGIK